jgi:hypothetical protein
MAMSLRRWELLPSSNISIPLDGDGYILSPLSFPHSV